VILAAAGQSSRYQDPNYKKPFAPLAGRPVWLHSAEKFTDRPDVKQVVVVVSPEDRAAFVEKFGASLALGRRVLVSNASVNVFHTGFNACNSYDQGLQAMAAVKCPVLMVLGDADQMTTPKGAQPLIKHAKDNGIALKVVMIPNGHHQMSESPDETLDALKKFLMDSATSA